MVILNNNPTKNLSKYTSIISGILSLTIFVVSTFQLFNKFQVHTNLVLFFSSIIVMILEVSLFKYCSKRCKLFYELLKENKFNLIKGVSYILLGSGVCFSYEINKY